MLACSVRSHPDPAFVIVMAGDVPVENFKGRDVAVCLFLLCRKVACVRFNYMSEMVYRMSVMAIYRMIFML